MNKRSLTVVLFGGLVLLAGSCRSTQAEDLPVSPPTGARADAPAADTNSPLLPAAEANIISPADVNAPGAAEPNAADSNSTSISAVGAAAFHARCASIFERYVDRNGMVDYRTLSRKRPELLEVLDLFRNLDRNEFAKWSVSDQTAFWINAYNIQLIKIILDNYPIQSSRVLRLLWPPNSIRHIKGIWDEYKFMIMDEQFTLKEIETRFLRLPSDDPRILLAISHGCISGPPLRNKPYCGDKLDEQLDEQVRNFLAGQHALKFDKERKVVLLSPLFKPTWYGQEFIDKYATDRKFKDQGDVTRAVLNFLLNYIPANDAAYLETANYSIDYITFDWTLNEQAR